MNAVAQHNLLKKYGYHLMPLWEVLELIELHEQQIRNRRRTKIDEEICKMLRHSEIKRCLIILKEIES